MFAFSIRSLKRCSSSSKRPPLRNLFLSSLASIRRVSPCRRSLKFSLVYPKNGKKRIAKIANAFTKNIFFNLHLFVWILRRKTFERA